MRGAASLREDHVAVSPSAGAEAALELDEFFWAWMMIRSRAITFRVQRGTDGVVEARRCMVPVVDFMNHACAPPPSASVSAPTGSRLAEELVAAAAAHPGPNVTLERRDDAVAWRATVDISPGEEVLWTYGDLSNEELWLWYGFVPDPPLHAGAAVTFQLPEAALRGGLGAVARGDSKDEAAARLALLMRAGVFSDGSGDEWDRRVLEFELRLGSPPRVLAGIAGIMCCTADESKSITAAVSGGGTGVGGEGEAVVDVRLSAESRRRAGRYVAYILDQVEPTVCGESGEVDWEDDVASPEGVDVMTWRAACRLRRGARGVFLAARPALTDESLLDRGEWIDAAVASLLVAC